MVDIEITEEAAEEMFGVSEELTTEISDEKRNRIVFMVIISEVQDFLDELNKEEISELVEETDGLSRGGVEKVIEYPNNDEDVTDEEIETFLTQLGFLDNSP